MNYAICDYVVLVIPDWFSLALSMLVLALVLASNWARWRTGKGWTKMAEKCAEAADGYARSGVRAISPSSSSRHNWACTEDSDASPTCPAISRSDGG